jgi:A/G-specific adenine glycosylase
MVRSEASPALVPLAAVRTIRRRLLAWFARHQRDLPWRANRDPYRIWVSEVMLQQTQVSTVIPYFKRFLEAFPTLIDLAEADEQDVLRLWEGLGYYRRARDLHRAARSLAAEFDGRIPDDPEAWQALPGVGRYILGAVLSQAFDRRLPIVETNSQRVLCRLFGQRADPRRGPGRHWLWQVAERLLPMRRVGEFNQALMELGALICAPRDASGFRNRSQCPPSRRTPSRSTRLRGLCDGETECCSFSGRPPADGPACGSFPTGRSCRVRLTTTQLGVC